MRKNFLLTFVYQTILYYGDGSLTILVRMIANTGKSRFGNCENLPFFNTFLKNLQ